MSSHRMRLSLVKMQAVRMLASSTRTCQSQRSSPSSAFYHYYSRSQLPKTTIKSIRDNCSNYHRLSNSKMRLFSVVPQPALADTENEHDISIVIQKKNKKKTEKIEDEDPLFANIESRPKPGGTWDPSNPLGWAKDFGSRCPTETAKLHKLACLRPGDEGYISLDEFHAKKLKGVTIVRSKEDAEIVMEKLMSAPPDVMHACDTEVMAIDLKQVGPVGNGFVTCASVYSGPDFDYGLGDGPGTALWIDNLDDAFGVLQCFKPWFEDERFLKVWHNYGFDRHVMWNEGIDCKGFGGDTMHMARLQNTARVMHPNLAHRGYSLEALTADLLNRRKTPMKEIFGVNRLRKDGSEGSIVDVPPVEILQRDPKFRTNWIGYSAYDARGTWLIREKLQEKLEKMPWTSDRKHNLYEFYYRYLRDFGEVLTDMERRGIRVDAKDYLAGVEVQARKDREEHLETFQKWAASQIGPDGLAINVGSATQLSVFLFGGSKNSKTKEETERVRVFQIPREEISEQALLAYEERDRKNKEEQKNFGLPVSDGMCTLSLL